MRPRTRNPAASAFLSLLVPGAGQLYAGARTRGLVLLGISAGLCLVAAALIATRPLELVLTVVSRPVFAAFLLANVALVAFRVFAIVDAWRSSAPTRSAFAAAVLVALAAVAAAPHVAVGYVAVRGYNALDTIFAEREPEDVLPAHGIFLPSADPRTGSDDRALHPDLAVRRRSLPESRPLAGSRHVFLGSERSFARPWVMILLLGSDRGPGQWGERTDTVIVVALERGTGRAVALGIPRNLVRVPLGGVAGSKLRRFPQPLNALYAFARTRPELFPGGRDPGATALKQTTSRLLGLRVDYYALVDLDGFRDVVDALGGVTIHVRERLVDEVTRPAWGETKPRIDVYPGRTYHFSGRTALAYVRSRKASSDYARMARQRCFLSAMARQLDVVSVLRHFPSLAETLEASMRTDIPLDRVPDLVRLAVAVEPRRTLTETFGIPYIARRRRSDRFPIPDVAKIQATVRDLILRPERARARRNIASVRESC